MQRRIGLAQALINDPDLVLLDEPTSGLDPIGCREVKDLILALASRGKTVILSSHLLADVEDVCDRVVIYYGGRVQASGPLAELLAHPDSVSITTPSLPREVLQQVLDLIRHHAAEDRVRVDTPTQNLESYFLSVVERARASAQETSGATSGSQVAAYLRGEAEGQSQPDRILERLSAPAPRKEAPEVTTPSTPTVDHDRLQSLTRADQPPEQAPPAAPAPQAEDLEQANAKLSALLGKPKS
jgi:ABC-2 type transport system ATP-binding protein